MSAGKTNACSENIPVKSHLFVHEPKLSPGQKLPRRAGRDLFEVGISSGTDAWLADREGAWVCVFILT